MWSDDCLPRTSLYNGAGSRCAFDIRILSQVTRVPKGSRVTFFSRLCTAIFLKSCACVSAQSVKHANRRETTEIDETQRKPMRRSANRRDTKQTDETQRKPTRDYANRRETTQIDERLRKSTRDCANRRDTTIRRYLRDPARSTRFSEIDAIQRD